MLHGESKINLIYTESCKLRNYVNTIKKTLDLMKEFSLNTAINASKEHSSNFSDVFKTIATQIRKNAVDMEQLLEKINDHINELVKFSLFGVKRSRLSENLIEGRELIQNDRYKNIDKIYYAIEQHSLKLEDLYVKISDQVMTIKKQHDLLQLSNRKIWLTMSNLKVENNVMNEKKDFFINIAEDLDSKNEFMNNKLDEMYKEILTIERLVGSRTLHK